MIHDFTIEKYEQLCAAILKSDYSTLTMERYFSSRSLPSRYIILRHDVDRKPQNALSLAKVEAKFGICSTFYFRHTPSVLKPKLIDEISKMGHEIGYHYETLSKTRGNIKKAIQLFDTELQNLRKICKINTISMHGRPLSRWDNRDLWTYADLSHFGLLGEVYLSIDYNKIYYFTDTGRNWRSTRYNVRDRVEGKTIPDLDSTDELITYISSENPKAICILTHPNRWTNNKLEWLMESLSDYLANSAKVLISKFYH
ncbi:MAG: hypothetical protein HKM93_02845 [Desulfobacteraceae bacterium]|nr:hypothetical protein [Desulfobacteraceae bacterium]